MFREDRIEVLRLDLWLLETRIEEIAKWINSADNDVVRREFMKHRWHLVQKGLELHTELLELYTKGE